MSSNLKLKSNAGGSVSLVVDDTLATDEEFNVSEGGIENGSNANGDYVKFPDGTAILRVVVDYTSLDVADGSIFKSGTITSDLPLTLNSSWGGAMKIDVVGIWGSCTIGDSTMTSTIHRGATSPSPRVGTWTIIGRWK